MQPTDQPKTDQPPPPPPRTSAAETYPGKAQSTETATGTTETTAPPAKQPGVGVSVGEKIKGAVHVIHGAGEELRGSVLGAFDTMRGRDVSQTEAGQISGKGKEEVHKGMERLKPGRYASKEETEGAKAGAAPAAEGQGGQPAAPPYRETAAAAGTGPGQYVPRAEEEKQAPPPQRDEAVATGASVGAGPGKDAPQAQERQPDLPSLQRTAGETEAETKTGAAPGQYQAPYGVRDNQSAPGNVAASQAEGQGVGQQTREGAGGLPAGERGPPPTTTAQQS